MTHPSRVPPHSDEAERGLLGAILIEPDKLDACIDAQVSTAAFYVPWHRALFSMLLEMKAEGRPIDVLTVSDRAKATSRTEEIGGESYIERLIDATPTATHAAYYAKIVMEKAALRDAIDACRETLDACFAGEEPPETILAGLGKRISDIHAFGAKEPSLVDIAAAQEKAWISAREQGYAGLPLPWAGLNKLLGGMLPGKVYTFAAYTSMGKSSLESCIVRHLCERGVMVGRMELEMTAGQTLARNACDMADTSLYAMNTGRASESHYKAAIDALKHLAKSWPMCISDTLSTALQVEARARTWKRKKGIKLLTIDHAGLLVSANKGESEVQANDRVSSMSMRIAKELDIPVVQLLQLSRDHKKRGGKPSLQDLRGSGRWEQDSYAAVFIYEDESREWNDDERPLIFDVAKHRDGPVGELPMTFYAKRFRFYEYTPPSDAPGAPNWRD